MDLMEIVFETLPSIIGLLLVALIVVLAYRRLGGFYHIVGSWMLALFVVSLAVLWVLELLKDELGGWALSSHAAIDVTFIVFWLWLSTCVVSLATIYRRQNTVSQFAAWLKRNPVNVMTISGVLALALIATTWRTDISDEDGLKKHAWLLWLVGTYMVGAFAFDFAVPVMTARRRQLPRISDDARRGMALLLMAWLGIPLAEFFLDLVAEMTLGYEDYNPYGWAMVLFFAIIMRLDLDRRFTAIVVHALVETAKREEFRTYDIPSGVYIIEDEKSDPAFGLFSELVTLRPRPDAEIPDNEESARGTLEPLIPKGMVVTREHPDVVREKHGLRVTPILWLAESQGEMRLGPTNLAALTDTLIRFMENNPNSIVLIDGIEYVTIFNEFKKVLRALDSLSETAWITKTTLLETVNPKTLNEKDIAFLERDRTVIKGAAGIEDFKSGSSV